MSDSRPLASVSIDVDNLWSYQKTHGDPEWERRGTYLPTLLPLALEALDRLDLRITFFLVGLDADDPRNADALAGVTRAGHEVGNHSYEHEPWLHRYPREQLAEELDRAGAAIQRATGQPPVGFRGPGYSWSATLFELLAERGYLFDASTLPTFLGPLARTYYFWTARLTPEERETRRMLFGTARDGLRPIRPYRWRLDRGRSLLEIPVTTMPGLRVPFHLSYLLWLARRSERLMHAYLATAITACRLARVEPSFLLHPLDLLGGDLVPQLGFFPGMDLDTATKRRLFLDVLGRLGRTFRLVPMSTHARAILGRPALRELAPVAAT